jgi:hypothetical protein
MFASLKKLVVVPAALVAALATAGCLKSDETITIYPDGSGKIQLKTTLTGMMAQMAKMGAQGGMQGMGGPGGEAPDPFKTIKDSLGGQVYWANLESKDGPAGEFMLSGTGYFEDINKVERKNGKISFSKATTGEGYELHVEGDTDQLKNGPLGGMGGDGDDANKTPEQKQQEEMAKQMAKSMMAGFDMKLSVIMPGAVTAAEGMTPGEGRKAVFALGEKELIEIMDGKRQPPKAMKVSCGAADPAVDGEMATFKKELAEAKAAAEKEKAAGAAKKPEAEKKPAGEKKQDF